MDFQRLQFIQHTLFCHHSCSAALTAQRAHKIVYFLVVIGGFGLQGQPNTCGADKY